MKQLDKKASNFLNELNPKIDADFSEAVRFSMLDESTKIIIYLDKVAKKQRKYNIAILACTIISAVAAVICVINIFL